MSLNMALIANVVLVVLSLLMGLRLVRRYVSRPRSHTLWYAVGLILCALAAFSEVYLAVAGNLPPVLWWSYWVSASALVGFLSVGTAYLLSPMVGRITLISVSVITAWLLIAVLTKAGSVPADIVLTKAPNTYVKVPFLIQNIAGSMLIFGGAIWSFVKTRAWYAVWIGAGTMVFASGQPLSDALHNLAVFYIMQTLGIVVLYLGITGSLAPRLPQVATTR